MPELSRVIPNPSRREVSEFVPVTLRRAVAMAGLTFPAGTRGIVVHRHEDGAAFEVEFTRPAEMVLTLTSDDLA